MKKTKQKKVLRLIKKGDKYQAYFDSLDLNSLWEKFVNTFNKNGTPAFKTVWAFICKEAKIEWQRKVLYWVIGPMVKVEKGQRPEFNLPQYDWEEKRKKGFWYSSENIEALKSDITSKAVAYDAVRAAGKVNVHTIARMHSLMNQLEEEFGGRIFLPELSQKENAMRAQLYMTLLSKCVEISNSAQVMHARSQGLDLERLDTFFSMFGTQMGKTAAMLMGSAGAEADAGHHLKSQFEKVVDMVATKASEFSLPLPDSLAAAIKEVSQPEKVVSKKKVN